jgi:hypothetical protein
MAKQKRKTTASQPTRQAPRKKASDLGPCAVEGCERQGNEVKPARRGPVVLCEGCAVIAKRPQVDEGRRLEKLDVAGTAQEKARARQKLRRIERVRAALR